MKKLINLLIVLTLLFCLTGCDWGAANDDVNVHIRNDDSIIIKVEEEYKEIEYISVRGENDRTSFTKSNPTNGQLFWDTNTNTLKIVQENDTIYIEIIGCSYVEIKYK